MPEKTDNELVYSQPIDGNESVHKANQGSEGKRTCKNKIESPVFWVNEFIYLFIYLLSIYYSCIYFYFTLDSLSRSGRSVNRSTKDEDNIRQ